MKNHAFWCLFCPNFILWLPSQIDGGRCVPGPGRRRGGSGVTFCNKIHLKQDFRNLLLALDFDLSLSKGHTPMDFFCLRWIWLDFSIDFFDIFRSKFFKQLQLYKHAFLIPRMRHFLPKTYRS